MIDMKKGDKAEGWRSEEKKGKWKKETMTSEITAKKIVMGEKEKCEDKYTR